MAVKPVGDFAGPGPLGDVERRGVLPARQPPDRCPRAASACAVIEPPAVAGGPEGVVQDVGGRRGRGCVQQREHPLGQAQAGEVGQRGRGAALDQRAGRLPTANAMASASGPPPATRRRRLDVRAGLEQRVEGLDVVRARRPVQRRLLVRSAEAGVDVRAVLDQDGDRRRDPGK